MPQRTNEFQDLAGLIQRCLAPTGARVTDSAMVQVDGLGTLREVDVLIEGEFGPYAVTVAVEAKDFGRKLSMEQFDSLFAKYRGECRILVDKLVIVTRRGFSEGVIEKAAKVDVELLTLDEAKGKDWLKVVPSSLNFSMPAHICTIEFSPPVPSDNPKDVWYQGRLICSQGHDHGTPMSRAQCLIFHQWVPRNPEFLQDVERQVRASPRGEGMIHATYPHEGFVVRHGGNDHAIKEIKIGVHLVLKQA